MHPPNLAPPRLPCRIAACDDLAREIGSRPDPTKANPYAIFFAGGFNWSSTFASVINPPPTRSCQVSVSLA